MNVSYREHVMYHKALHDSIVFLLDTFTIIIMIVICVIFAHSLQNIMNPAATGMIPVQVSCQYLMHTASYI